MQDGMPAGNLNHEWRICHLIFPRIGTLLDRRGMHMRLILPGEYYARRSRSLGRWIYRRCSG